MQNFLLFRDSPVIPLRRSRSPLSLSILLDSGASGQFHFSGHKNERRITEWESRAGGRSSGSKTSKIALEKVREERREKWNWSQCWSSIEQKKRVLFKMIRGLPLQTECNGEMGRQEKYMKKYLSRYLIIHVLKEKRREVLGEGRIGFLWHVGWFTALSC